MALRLLLDTNVILGVLKGSFEWARVNGLQDAQAEEDQPATSIYW